MTQRPGPDPDATYVVRKGSRARRTWLVAGGLALALALGGLVLLRDVRDGPPAPASSVGVAALRGIEIPPADEAALLSAPCDRLTYWRFAARPSVLVLVYPSLHAQALALNRVAAFVEKAGMPHDRVVSDTELAAAIAAQHDSFDYYYEAHDYRAADLARYFTTAARDDVTLRPEELALRGVVAGAKLLVPGAVGALITIPPQGTGFLDAAGRAAILRHELSHGFYFTDPAYAAVVDGFWAHTMSEAERAAFRRFLARLQYDSADDLLMRNEMQAYLLFTPDHRLFAPERLGLAPGEVDSLRTALAARLPAGWLAEHAGLR